MNRNTAFLLIGGNLGDRLNYLNLACKAIEQRCGQIISGSSVYETEAWGLKEQNAFYNQALKIETKLNAKELLNCILKIEESLGRKRDKKYGPRTIDIDILLFNDEIIEAKNLKVPHPELHNRRFALECLNEIASAEIHPVFNKTINQLLAECPDPLSVNKIN
jgi:2-amino-4-hydroxy-6-hydroxymethyldihydropteridine diphosphokinase